LHTGTDGLLGSVADGSVLEDDDVHDEDCGLESITRTGRLRRPLAVTIEAAVAILVEVLSKNE
jgi:hypothetical protein